MLQPIMKMCYIQEPCHQLIHLLYAQESPSMIAFHYQCQQRDRMFLQEWESQIHLASSSYLWFEYVLHDTEK